MYSSFRIFSICTVFLIFISPYAPADTIWVDTVLDSGVCGCSVVHSCCSLRNSLSAADSGDTITFRQTLSGSTLTLSGGQLVISKNLIIDGDLDNDLSPDITISTSTEDRIFSISGSLLVSLDGLFIRDGNPPVVNYGGGIAIGTGGITTIRNSRIAFNGDWRTIWNQRGGAIYNGGTLFLENCHLHSNEGYNGGSVYNTGALSVSNSRIGLNNSKAYGAGIYNSDGGSVVIQQSEIGSNNLFRLIGDPAGQVGAGVYNRGSLIVNKSTFKYNNIENRSVPGPNFPIYGTGGAIYNIGTATIRHSTFTSNSASVGGAIVNANQLILENSTLHNNDADTGGGIYNSTVGSAPGSEETMVIRNCTINYNIAQPGQGGGIHIAWASGPGGEHISNTIIANNDHFSNADDCHLVSGRGTWETNAYNIIEDGSCYALYTVDPLLGDLEDNGGSTETLALKKGSPAINAGRNASVPGNMTTDQRGSGFPRIRNGRVDIGAFEYDKVVLFPIRSTDGKTIIVPF